MAQAIAAQFPQLQAGTWPAQGRSRADERASRLFFHLGFIGCIVLQRFGVFSGGTVYTLTLPWTLALMGWIVLSGRAQVRPASGLLYLAFLTVVAIGTTIALAFPDERVSISLLSPIALIANYALFVFRPGQRFDSSMGLEIFLFYARVCAVAGILQYAIQFAGIYWFSFSQMFPALQPILIEATFNVDAATGWNSGTYRANGFFLLEPSIFSQMIVMAVCIEYFLLKRTKFLPVYGVAYLLSHSGTGLLCLAITLPLYMVFFYRQASRVMLFGVLASLLVLALAFALPDQFSQVAGRAEEFQHERSSGYARYVGQFITVNAVADDLRTIIGFGPGATERASFFFYGSNGPIQKLVVDYGYVGFIIFMTFLIRTVWRRDLAIVPLLFLVCFMFAGGKLLSTYFIVQMMLICVWASAPPKPEVEGPAVAGQAREA